MRSNELHNRGRRPSNKTAAPGVEFEDKVRAILKSANKASCGYLTYKEKPKLELQNGEVTVPDFAVRIELPHEVRHFLVECQNRKRSTKTILHKIQHIRQKHRSKTFLFVHPAALGRELARTLAEEGIQSFTLEEFRGYMHDAANTAALVHSSLSASASMVESQRSILLSKTQHAFYSGRDTELPLDDVVDNETLDTSKDSKNDKTELAFG